MTDSAEPARSADPLIDEVRERRRAVFARCGNDLRVLGQHIQTLQAQHPEKVIDRRRAGTGEKRPR
jgi:hypothetical protein